jgi:hypothetical protein
MHRAILIVILSASGISWTFAQNTPGDQRARQGLREVAYERDGKWIAMDCRPIALHGEYVDIELANGVKRRLLLKNFADLDQVRIVSDILLRSIAVWPLMFDVP